MCDVRGLKWTLLDLITRTTSNCSRYRYLCICSEKLAGRLQAVITVTRDLVDFRMSISAHPARTDNVLQPVQKTK